MEKETYFLTGERHEYYVNLVLQEMKQLAPNAYRAYAMSEDGEAVVGTDEEDNLIYIMHFDPESREAIDEAHEQKRLKDLIIAYNSEML